MLLMLNALDQRITTHLGHLQISYHTCAVLIILFEPLPRYIAINTQLELAL
jgi:hypothetical protein